MKLKFNLKDHASIQAKLAHKNLSKACSVALLDAGQEMQGGAKAAAPFATGTLRRGIHLVKKKKKGLITKIMVGTSKIPYARIQDLGGRTGRNRSVKIKAKKYIKGQLDKMKNGRMAKILDEAIAENL